MSDFSEELDSLWDFGNPEASEKRFREAADGARRAEALTQLARAVGLQKRFDEASEILEEAEALGGGDLVAARIALERGRLLRDTGCDAKPAFEKARLLCEANGFEFYAVDAVHMLALCESGNDAILLNQQAIDFAAKSESLRVRQWQVSLLNNLGWSYFDVGNFDRALDCFLKTVRMREKRGEVKEAGIARWCAGRTLRELGRLDEALEIQYALMTADGSGFASEEIGECLLLAGKPEAARPYFARAAVRLLGKVADERLQRLSDIGRGSTFGKLSANAIRFSRTLPVDRSQIWNMVATPEGISQWLGTVVGTMTAPNSKIEIRIEDDPDDIVACRILDYFLEQTLTLVWEAGSTAESILSFEVADKRLILKHRGPGHLAKYGAAWHSALDLITHLLEGKARDAFTENYQHLLPEYQRLVSH